MKYLLIIFFILIRLTSDAQSFTQTFSLCDSTFNITCEILTDNSLKVEIKNGLNPTNKYTDTIVTDDMDVFASNFKNLFNKLGATTCAKADYDKLVSIGRNTFLKLKTSLADTSSPAAGIFKVMDSVSLEMQYHYRNSLKIYKAITPNKYKVEKLQVETNNGYIENIKVLINIDGVIATYTSLIPIGISSVRNFKNYSNVYLYNADSPYFKPHCKQCDTSAYILSLSRLINYDNLYAVDRRDYSPQDTAFTLLGGQAITLYKQRTNKLFEAHIYTDFVGLNEEKPNGLIQTEVTKRININTVQHIMPLAFRSVIQSYGFFQFISPTVTYSKIEQHNKRLLLGDLDSIRFNPGLVDTSRFKKPYHRYVNALDLYQYQSFSAGTLLNLFYLNNHDLKYTLYANIGARFGITQITDSLTNTHNDTISKTGYTNETSVNTLQFYPEVSLTFLPEERFNFSLTDRMIYIKTVNPDIQLLSFYKYDSRKLTTKTDRWLNSLELLMTIQTNENSKVFGRIRFISALKNSDNNFAQIQVGYSTYILGK